MKSVIIAVLLALNLFGAASEGEPAPELNVASLDGSRHYTIADFKGKVVLLNLWASWCSGCKKEMPLFFKLQKSYGDDLKIVTVSIDSEAGDSQAFLKSIEKRLQYETPFITAYDPEKSVPERYGAMGMPSSYLIDKNGVVRRIIVGSLDSDGLSALQTEIDKLR